MRAVLDAYAVIAALIGERARIEVEPLLREGLVCAPNVGEVIDVCVRVYRNEAAVVHERVNWLVSGGLQIAVLEAEMASEAGALRARYYRKRICEVSLGDCFALALAKQRGLALATSDPALADVVKAENLKLIGLPDSKGKRP